MPQISVNIRLCIVQNLPLTLSNVLLLLMINFQTAFNRYKRQSTQYRFMKIRFDRVEKTFAKYRCNCRHQ